MQKDKRQVGKTTTAKEQSGSKIIRVFNEKDEHTLGIELTFRVERKQFIDLAIYKIIGDNYEQVEISPQNIDPLIFQLQKAKELIEKFNL